MVSTNLDTKNVMGAQSGTLLKGLRTKRRGNPLIGDYQLPGWSELADKNNPFSLSKTEQLRKNGTQTTLTKTSLQQINSVPKQDQQELPEIRQKSATASQPSVAQSTSQRFKKSTGDASAQEHVLSEQNLSKHVSDHFCVQQGLTDILILGCKHVESGELLEERQEVPWRAIVSHVSLLCSSSIRCQQA